ncbi:MAG: hypothetical protein K2G51_09825 [Lachnospiraceae bacterium]|nr:hypothetical protein [Lachnospiraceae bacterium]MDE7273188.1 hypothetical protein [Lachnospiraceae bacterium]
MKVNQYQFDNICRQMEKEFGKVRKGEEDQYIPFLMAIEGNLLKTHRQFQASNSRRLLEAVPLALFQLKRNMTGEDYELERYQSVDNERLVHAILMAFDPLTNEEIADAFREKGIVELNNQEMLRDIYAISIMCILRIKESVELFVQQLGSDGYFDFLEETIGTEVPQNDEFHYTVILPENMAPEEQASEDDIQDAVQKQKRKTIFSRLFKKRS